MSYLAEYYGTIDDGGPDTNVDHFAWGSKAYRFNRYASPDIEDGGPDLDQRPFASLVKGEAITASGPKRGFNLDTLAARLLQTAIKAPDQKRGFNL